MNESADFYANRMTSCRVQWWNMILWHKLGCRETRPTTTTISPTPSSDDVLAVHNKRGTLFSSGAPASTSVPLTAAVVVGWDGVAEQPRPSRMHGLTAINFAQTLFTWTPTRSTDNPQVEWASAPNPAQPPLQQYTLRLHWTATVDHVRWCVETGTDFACPDCENHVFNSVRNLFDSNLSWQPCIFQLPQSSPFVDTALLYYGEWVGWGGQIQHHNNNKQTYSTKCIRCTECILYCTGIVGDWVTKWGEGVGSCSTV